MGSNGVRFSISNLAPPSGRIMPVVFQDRAGISLYDAQFSGGDKARGPIPDDIIERIVSRLVGFKTTCEDFGVPKGNVYVLATEATRTAPNSEEFRARIKAATDWDVCLLSKEDEGRIGALGVASSSTSIAGLMMDLGGGSTQLSWVVEQDGVVSISPKGSFSFPYGAAALSRMLEQQVYGKGASVRKQLKDTIKKNFKDAYEQLELPASLQELAESQSGLDLYLCGGGFRGWGYLLMSQSNIRPYPIPIINGYRAAKEQFHDTSALVNVVSDSTAKIFGVSKRRASQVPAVAFLVEVVTEALAVIKTVQFCQGGVREGFLFEKLPREIRIQDPLLVATGPHAPPSRDAIRDMLLSALPKASSVYSSIRVPGSFTRALVTALTNILYTHSSVHRETRAAAALHSTTTGILATANSLSHGDRALLALMLTERWSGDLSPADQSLRDRLAQIVTASEAWWSLYLGRVAALVCDVYPAGRIPTDSWRIRLQSRWEVAVMKKERVDALCVDVAVNKPASAEVSESLPANAKSIEKLGKKKHWTMPSAADERRREGHGVRDLRVAVTINWPSN